MRKEKLEEMMDRRVAGLSKKPSAPSFPDPAPLGNQQAQTLPDLDSRLIDPNKIDSDANQPRKQFDEDELSQLAGSVESVGQLNQCTVYPIKDTDRFRLVAGERRWRVAKAKGLMLRCFVLKEQPNENTRDRMQLDENDNRSDLNFIERGNKYREMMERNGWTAGQLAKEVNRSESQIRKALSVEEISSQDLKDAVASGDVPTEAAYQSSRIEDPNERKEMEQKLRSGDATTADAKRAANWKRRSKRGRKTKTVASSAPAPGATDVTPLQVVRSDLAQLIDSLKLLSAEELPAFIAEAQAALKAASKKAA